jgi:hypothetical protein
MVDTKLGGDHAEYFGMLRRMLRAGARRLADSDPDDLPALVSLRDQLDTAIVQAVTGQRDNGFSWAQIGEALGMSRQAAQQKYGAKVAAEMARRQETEK